MSLKSRIMLLTVVVATLVLLAVAGCARHPEGSHAQNAPASPAPSPKLITPADLAKLRWIEGSWRGTGDGQAPFYERYKFENDTTLVVETLTDETLSKVSEVDRFELKDGHFGKSANDSGSVATALDDTSITFSPLGKARNSFRFQRESDNAWRAILNWTDKDGAAKERIYHMERLGLRNP
ncbi:MAG TPA: hypothetical protein VMS31_21405 [Pyrinomonadaceae bacterium]|nr:hypothetical protein [Pyrinomonadaceae bacterium]